MSLPKLPVLNVEPSDKLRFIGDPKTSELKTTIRITSKGDTKLCFKVKCTRNDLFRIRPALGIIDFNQTATVDVFFKAVAEYEVDKLFFGVYYIPAPEGCTCEGAWAEHYGPAMGEVRLRVAFEEKK